MLYGQFVSRLSRLTAADIEQHGPDTCLRLDTVPVLLPPRLAVLVRAQFDAAPAHPRNPGPRPLFPGRSPARPVAPQTLTRRLRQHGIEPRQARNAALTAWASDLPPRYWPACSASTSRPPSTWPATPAATGSPTSPNG